MDIDKLKEIGNIARNIKKEIAPKVKKGVNILQIIEEIEEKVLSLGYKPAFPCTICINEQAAHFTVYDEEVIFNIGDVVKVDFGIVDTEGNIVDTAFTVEIETEKYKSQLIANRNGLDEVLNFIGSNTKLYEIGKFIDEYAKEDGFSTIHNLAGHQIEKNNLHAGISIPNYNNSSMTKLSENILVAIEPFFSNGSNKVIENRNSNILILSNNRNVRDSIAKKVLVKIREEYSQLPFSKRWLLRHFKKNEVNYALRILKKDGIVYEYNVLVSEDNSIITQFEETVLIQNNEKIILT